MGATSEADPEFALAMSIARKAADGSLEDLTGNADSYYADSISPPYWVAHATFTVQIGHHRFYRVEFPSFHDAPAIAQA
jgi:hypothetical protein